VSLLVALCPLPVESTTVSAASLPHNEANYKTDGACCSRSSVKYSCVVIVARSAAQRCPGC